MEILAAVVVMYLLLVFGGKIIKSIIGVLAWLLVAAIVIAIIFAVGKALLYLIFSAAIIAVLVCIFFR